MKNGRHEDKYGTVRWYKDDKIHRTDGPAVEHVDGNKFWFQNGKFHRTDGPAIEHANGREEWFILDHKVCETKKPNTECK